MSGYKYSYKDTLKENMGLAVYNTGYQKCDGPYAWGPGQRDHYLVHYIVSGKGRFFSEGRTYALEEGSLFLVCPSRLVTYAADADDPWEYVWVGFNGTEARRLLHLTGLSEASPVLQVGGCADIRQALMDIYLNRGNTPAADTEMVGRLYLFFSRLIQRQEGTADDWSPRDYVEQALRYIQYNFAGPLTVSEIAAYAGVSRSQLYRAFQENLGMSPHDYLQKYRVNEACSLLCSRKLTVSEVAASVGYTDPLYFSRAFKRLKGMNPTDYQREMRDKRR